MKALILVDLQNDFCPGGALAVPAGDEAIAFASDLQKTFSHLFFTQDWHPPHHLSFASSHPGKFPGDTLSLGGAPQTLWPDHCVQGSPGADFHPDLEIPPHAQIVRKGEILEIDSYSGFMDNDRLHRTDLHDRLQAKGITTVHIAGLATDYCVLYTVLDACALGYEVVLESKGCRGVNLHSQDSAKAVAKMATAGARIQA